MTDVRTESNPGFAGSLLGRLDRALHERRQTPIVPPANVAGRALMTVIGIMTFLACLTLGAVLLVAETASVWQGQIAREVTVQILPDEGLDMEVALTTIRDLARDFEGVQSAEILGEDATARLLEPWIGKGLDFEELPIPRLVVIAIDPADPPDFAAMRAAMEKAVPESSLDDHRAWASRLVAMARATVIVGLSILALVMVATVLTVVFATRGAMSGNRHIIEVLHFVGARAGFVASLFERHFLKLGLAGAVAGGTGALVVFFVIGRWTASNRTAPEADQISALFGSFAIGWSGYAGIAAVIVAVAMLTAFTSRITVKRQLAAIDMISPVEG